MKHREIVTMNRLLPKSFARLKVELTTVVCALVGMVLLAGCSQMPAIPGMTGASSPAVAQAQPVQESTPTAQFEPTLAVDPPGGYGGIYIRVTGDGWPRNMLVLVALADDTGKSSTLASVDTDFEGRLSTGFLYPIDARWLDSRAYQVIAMTADGRHEATALFQIGEPGTEIAAAPQVAPTLDDAQSNDDAAAEIVPEAEEPPQEAADSEETATAAIEEADSENSATAAESAGADAAIAEDAVEEVAEEVAQEVAESAPESLPAVAAESGDKGELHATGQSDDLPVAFGVDSIVAEFIPVDVKRDKGKFIIHAQAPGHVEAGYQLVAVIRTPSPAEYGKIELDRDDDWEVKFTRSKVEIEAPDPQALREFMETYGGFPVTDGQPVEIKLHRSHNMQLELDDGVLEIKASQVALQVLLIGPDGQTEMAVATIDAMNQPPGHSRGRGPVVSVPPAGPLSGFPPEGRPPSWARNARGD